jgi:hypothetical protein
MKRVHTITALALTGALGLTTIFAPVAANASEEGSRNTAIALGVTALALLLTQNHGHHDYRGGDVSWRHDDHRFDRDYRVPDRHR